MEKKGKRRTVGILVALVLVLSAGAAGAVFAPRLFSKPTPPDAESAAESEEADTDEDAEEAESRGKPRDKERATGTPKQRAGQVGPLTELSPMVIDARAADGSVRHIKVVLVVEHPKEVTADAFKKLIPFAREAAISYLRTREFEILADPRNFEALRKQLATEIIDAVGEKHARRVLITDYVVQ